MRSKGFTSTNVLGVVDYDGRFLAVFPGVEGCASDGYLFRMCSTFSRAIPAGMFYLGDAGFTLSNSVLTPYRSTRYHLREWSIDPEGRPREPKELFNYRHSKARIIVEQAFGLLKRKWRILDRPMEVETRRVNEIVHVCCALHNFLLAVRTDLTDDDNDDSADALTLNDEDITLSAELDLLLDASATNEAQLWRDAIALDMWQAYQLYRQDNE